jgi:hypothetical protein
LHLVAKIRAITFPLYTNNTRFRAKLSRLFFQKGELQRPFGDGHHNGRKVHEKYEKILPTDKELQIQASGHKSELAQSQKTRS